MILKNCMVSCRFLSHIRQEKQVLCTMCYLETWGLHEALLSMKKRVTLRNVQCDVK